MSIPLPLLRNTPTHEETREEGRVLLSSFVDYQVAQQGAMDAGAGGESIGDMVYSHTIDEEDIGTPHSRTEAEALHPVYRNMGRELRALADRFSQSRERIRVRQEADSLDISSLTRDNLMTLMLELFEDGFSRERLVTFFFFCSDLILKSVRCSVGGLRWQVVAWVWAFLRDRVCYWVLQHGGWEAVLTNYLPKLAITAAGFAVGQPVPSETWSSVEAVAQKLAATWDEDVEWEAVTDLFRFLRNSFAGSPGNAATATRNDVLMQSLKTLVKGLCELHIKDASHAECVVGLRCSLQCLGNLVCSHQSSENLVWELLMAQESQMCPVLLRSPDVKVRQYCSMVLYNCLSPAHVESILRSTGSVGMIESLADMLINTESEWSLFILERLLQHDDLVTVFQKLSARCRCVLLDIAADDLIKKQGEDAPIPISLPFLEHAQSQLLERVWTMTKCLEAAAAGDPEISEICKLLKVLCLASANEEFKGSFADGSELLATALEVLKTVHLLGKSSQNAFTPAPRLDDFSAVEKGALELTGHHSFGFKRDLVQLIGNMCHQNRKHQDMIRNLDGIPLILDVCNLDAKNPFIIQHVTLAIRNLMEANPENQAVVGSLVQQGVVTDSPLIKEMGINIE
ncbi:ataxin-10 isoform X2 [Dermacentor variabilis]